MSILDILKLIPDSFQREIVDALVDLVSGQARKLLGDQASDTLRKLRSDAGFTQAFQKGLQRAAERFAREYEAEDEDLVAAMAADEDFFQNEQIQQALLAIIKKPGLYLADERETVLQSFETVLPERKNRQRVDRTVTFFLKCLAEELWTLPELQGVYSLQFQRMTAEAVRQQVELQKAQLQATVGLSADVRDALIQLTHAIAEQRALPGSEVPALPEPPQVYHNLPQPDYGTFIGRERELAQIQQLLSPDSRHFLVTIDGIGGIGKSALALEVAHRYLREYDRLLAKERFEAIIWTSAKTSVLTADGIAPRQQIMRTLDDIYTAIAVALQREDITRARPEEQGERVTQALTRQRTLLIVDNLETVDDERVNAFLRELPIPTKAIVTTRHRIDVAYPVRLTGMPRGDGLFLITQECDRKNVTLTETETEKLYDRTGGVPLAIVWSVAQMGYGYGVDGVFHRLGDAKGDIARFCFEGIVACIRGESAHKLLIALSFFVRDAKRDALGRVAALLELERDEGLVRLEKLSLVNKYTDRFALLPLTKVFVLAERTNFPDFEMDAGRRWVDYLKSLCPAQDSEVWRYRDYVSHNEGPDIIEAIQWSYEHGTVEDVFQLALAANDYLYAIGDWNKSIVLCRPALSLARSIQDSVAIARFTLMEGLVLYRWENYEEAESRFLESLGHYQQINNEGGECIALCGLCATYRKRRLFEQAKVFCEQAWNIAKNSYIDNLEPLVNAEYGNLARDMEDWESAWKYFDKARAWFEVQDKQTQGERLFKNILGNLALVAYHLGQYQKAKELCLKSLEFFEEHGEKASLADQKYRLALIEEALGESESALGHVQEALDCFDRLGMKADHNEAVALLARLEQN
jgi:LuxR family glucitol operon transcriptional activator